MRRVVHKLDFWTWPAACFDFGRPGIVTTSATEKIWAHFHKLRTASLWKKFPSFCVNTRFSTCWCEASMDPYFEPDNSVTSWHPILLRSNLTSSYHLYLVLQEASFRQVIWLYFSIYFCFLSCLKTVVTVT